MPPGLRRPPAKRENVSFYDSPDAAEAAGYRPCKRRRPNVASEDGCRREAVARACRLIETAEEALRLDQIAAAAGMSPFHFHRVSKAATGLTPKAYAAAIRAVRVRARSQKRQA